MDMEYQIKEMIKILNLKNYNNGEIAKLIAEPTKELLAALNILLGCEYYSDWCYETDYLIMEIKKEEIIISTWVGDVEVNDAVAIKGYDFETISILLKLIKQI